LLDLQIVLSDAVTVGVGGSRRGGGGGLGAALEAPDEILAIPMTTTF